MSRILIAIAVIAGVWYFAGTAIGSLGSSGTSKAADTVRLYAGNRHLPIDTVSCQKSTVAPASISYVSHAILPEDSDVTMYQCDVTLNPAAGLPDETWCVPGTSGPRPWTTVNESCQAWAEATN